MSREECCEDEVDDAEEQDSASVQDRELTIGHGRDPIHDPMESDALSWKFLAHDCCGGGVAGVGDVGDGAATAALAGVASAGFAGLPVTEELFEASVL